MALEREKQQKTLANRIGVNRGQGYTTAASGLAQAERAIEKTVNQFSYSAEKYLTRENTKRGEERARNQEFGRKPITYTNDDGTTYEMDMVVPIDPPTFLSKSEEEAYTKESFILYKNATRNALYRVVDDTYNQSIDANASMPDFQKMVEARTQVYIDKLPSNFKSIGKGFVSDRVVERAPLVDKNFIAVRNKASELEITNSINTVKKESFEATIMNNPLMIGELEKDMEENLYLIENARYFASDAHKQHAINVLKGDYVVNEKIRAVFGDSLAHDPTDDISGSLGVTVTNLEALHSILTNPSIGSVDITMDNGKVKTITRSEIKDSVTPEVWHEISETKAKSVKDLITHAKTKATAQAKHEATFNKLKIKNTIITDSDDVFEDARIRQYLFDEYKKSKPNKHINDQEILMDPDFYMFTLDEYEVLEPTMLQKIKKFSNRPDPGAMDSFTASVLSKVLDSKLSYTALDLTDQQRAVLENFTDKIREGVGVDAAVSRSAMVKELELDRESVHNSLFTNYLSNNKENINEDFNSKDKFNRYVTNKIVNDHLDDAGFFDTDEGTMISAFIVNDIKREIAARVTSPNAVPLTNELMDHVIAKKLARIRSGNDPRYGYSVSSIPGMAATYEGVDASQPAFVRHPPETLYGENGTIDFMLPLIEEMIRDEIKNSDAFSADIDSFSFGETFEDSNVRLGISHTGNPKNPAYNLYIADNGGGTQLYGNQMLVLTKENFKEEAYKYRNYMKHAPDGMPFKEWRASHGDD